MKRQQDYEHTDSFFTAEQMTGSGQMDMLAQIASMNQERRAEKLNGKITKQYESDSTKNQ